MEIFIQNDEQNDEGVTDDEIKIATPFIKIPTNTTKVLEFLGA